MHVERDHIVALREKYLELRRLRLEDAAERAGDPRPAMRALAARFPGALREIDELPMAEIESRIGALDAVLEGASPPDWAAYFVAYHGWFRAALRIKRLCRGAASSEEALDRLRQRYRAASDEPGLDELDAAAIADIRRPPGGRLNPWIYARIGDSAGVDADVVRLALFPPRHGRTCDT